MTIDPKKIRFAFFGTSRFAEILLDELKEKFGILPALIVTTPDRPAGRKQIMTASPVKLWAKKNDIKCLQPEKLKDENFLVELGSDFDVFVVASYGKIIPKQVLDIPRRGTLNVHPSLLPNYRGASPLQTQILHGEKNVGTTIMLMDEQVDHGPILMQEKIAHENLDDTFFSYTELEKKLAEQSAILLAKTLSAWLEGSIKPQEQNHTEATFTKMMEKNNGQIDLDANPLQNYRTYLAYEKWPGVFFFAKNSDGRNMRVLIKKAEFKDGKFIPLVVVPEGKKEMSYAIFLDTFLKRSI